MLNFIDRFLDTITMYRLVLYVLFFFFVSALGLSLFGFLPYTAISMIMSVFVLVAVSQTTNIIFSRVFKVPANVESIYITAFILFFIITPPFKENYLQFLSFAFWLSGLAIASKYIFVIGKKHIFNPAALAVVFTAFTINEFASWWIGTIYMLPFVITGGVLIVRKIRHTDLVFSFFIMVLVTTMGFVFFKGTDPLFVLYKTFIDSVFFFFAFIMLTEPMTTPPTRWLRIVYGAIVGFLFVPAFHIGSLYSTPEFALIIGNIFAYAVSPKEKLILKLKERIKVASNIFDFVFTNDQKFHFHPGQYMEWTLAHRSPDTRGNRRFFTIASSPTENDIRIGVKFYSKPSSLKNHMANLNVGDEIVASQRGGDFVLPEDKTQKLVFIAGGIGITPFRSMIKYLLDNNEKRTITMLYSNKTIADIAYRDIFDVAEAQLGIKTIYVITDFEEMPFGFNARQGFIDANMIKNEIPDFMKRIFYISGPHNMVVAFRATLKAMGVKRNYIKTDFFPGFA